MAYNSYYPQYYPSAMPSPYMQAPQQAPQAATVQNNQSAASNGITWVQGENAAKSYPVGAGQSVLLMDSEDSVMYIKSCDQSGVPLPLRIFDYTERKTGHSEAGAAVAGPGSQADYISRQEFDEFKEDIKRTIKGLRRPTKRTEDEEE